MGIERWIDLCFLLVGMCFAVIVLNICTVEFSKSLSTITEDKTVVKTQEELLVDDSLKTGKDLLMSLVIADEFITYPRAIKINDSPVIQLTDNWLMVKNQNIAQIYSTTGAYKLGAMLEWNVVNVQYIYENNSNGYLWYQLIP